jgi:hypothetical protein
VDDTGAVGTGDGEDEAGSHVESKSATVLNPQSWRERKTRCLQGSNLEAFLNDDSSGIGAGPPDSIYLHLHLISSALLDFDVLLLYLLLNPSVFLTASQVQTIAPPSPDRLPATSRRDFQPLATVTL